MLLTEFKQIIEQISQSRRIDVDTLINVVKDAIKVAAKKRYGNDIDIEIHYNQQTYEIEAFQFKEVVETVNNDVTEIGFEDAEILDPDCAIGDSLGIKIDVSEFGRIAAQAAKQIILNKVRNAEQEKIYESYKNKKGQIVHGTVIRENKGDIIVNLGNAEAMLPVKEQIPGEVYNKANMRIKAYVLDIVSNEKGTHIILSRTHPYFLINLFKVEVPEVSDGTIELLGATRLPGIRSKVAVKSLDSNVDPVGACVGIRGSRVQNIVQELKGEKIDIVPWDADPVKFVCNASAPAEIKRVILDERNKSMEIIVSDQSLSITIGKKGQNVKLASHLTKWKLDVKSEAEYSKIIKNGYNSLISLPNISIEAVEALNKNGFFSLEDISKSSIEELLKIEGITKEAALSLIHEAKK